MRPTKLMMKVMKAPLEVWKLKPRAAKVSCHVRLNYRTRVDLGTAEAIVHLRADYFSGLDSTLDPQLPSAIVSRLLSLGNRRQ